MTPFTVFIWQHQALTFAGSSVPKVFGPNGRNPSPEVFSERRRLAVKHRGHSITLRGVATYGGTFGANVDGGAFGLPCLHADVNHGGDPVCGGMQQGSAQKGGNQPLAKPADFAVACLSVLRGQDSAACMPQEKNLVAGSN